MLDGVRVLDLSHLLPGQFATALLAQLGAEVVMVERPEGHQSRAYPTSFGMYNHSKQSVVVDLKDERGRKAFHSLAAKSDVVVEQFRPGVVSRLGVDHESVADTNPDVVYCSISGYGQDGPYANAVGHDVNYAATSGILDQTGDADSSPVIPGAPITDIGTSVFAALSIAAALSGDGGEYIDLSMTDVGVNFASNLLAEYNGRGSLYRRGEGRLTGGYPCYNVYQCADGGYLSVAAMEPHFWTALCEALDLPGIVDDQWASNERRDEVFARLAARFETRTVDEWMTQLDRSEVPVAPVTPVEDVPESTQVRHRDLIRSVDDGTSKDTHTVTFPAAFAGHDVAVDSPPVKGAHTRDRLANAGYDDAAIQALEADGVIETTR